MKTTVKKYNSDNLFKYSIIFWVLILFCSCSAIHQKFNGSPGDKSTNLSGDKKSKIDSLQHDLAALDDNIDISEARKLAETSINYSLFLADEYRLVWPPYLHNILVRIGIKERGLCYQWSEDLMKRLTSLELKSFIFHEGVAHKSSNLREHNSVVVTARGQDFNEGIVLDPWRDSGDLYWSSVKTDKYPWEER